MSSTSAYRSSTCRVENSCSGGAGEQAICVGAGEQSMSFKDKRRFFEQEIAQQSVQRPKEPARKFSFLQEHEVLLLKKEDAKKMSSMSQSMTSAEEMFSAKNDTFESVISSVAESKTNRSATERLFNRQPSLQSKTSHAIAAVLNSTNNQHQLSDDHGAVLNSTNNQHNLSYDESIQDCNTAITAATSKMIIYHN